MIITKAVITAAGPDQRRLPLQTLIDRDGEVKSLLRILVDESVEAGIEDIGIVVHPGDEEAFTAALGSVNGRLHFIPQAEPAGYGHAVSLTRDFIGGNPFLHLVGDHLWISRTPDRCAKQLVELAAAEDCAVSAVQATRESLLPYFGVVGGKRMPGHQKVYRIDVVREKPTPTEAEQRLIVPGLRAGHYLCFFGMHVLTPSIFGWLERRLGEESGRAISLSPALADLAEHEQYLAVELPAQRYDMGTRYGLFTAQLALALSGQDRDQVLSILLEVLASREIGRTEQ